MVMCLLALHCRALLSNLEVKKKPKDKTIKIIEKTVMMEAEINKKHYPNWLKLPRDTLQ